MGIGERIKSRRTELGLTLEEVGKKVGINRSTVLRYESGKIKKISENMLDSFALALETTPEELLGLNEKTCFSGKVLTLARKMQELPKDKLDLLSGIVASMCETADEEAKK